MKVKFIFLLPFAFMTSFSVNASTNVAIAEFVNSIRGSFNMVVAPKHVVSARRLKKTNRMIEKGYRSEVLNMQILLEESGLDANIRMFESRLYPDFPEQNKEASKNVQAMTETLSKELKRRLEGSAFDTSLTTTAAKPEESSDDIELSDDIGTDIDFDDTLFEVSDEKIDDGTGTGTLVSLEQIATDTFLSIAMQYNRLPAFRNREVLWYAGGSEEKVTLGKGTPNMKKVFIPFYNDGILRPLPLHSIFATTFMPNRNGVLHVMEMYIILVVNEAEHGKARVAYRKIDKFRWDRNPYYISAATGTVLKKIFTNAIGKKLGSH